jgi:hypothetical protein
MFEMLMARVSAIACGYEDANDLDRSRHDPLMKLAVGRCTQPRRLGLAPGLRARDLGIGRDLAVERGV